MEQNLGPHMEQKWESLAPSWGRVSSWKARAVSGSIERSNWSCQRNSKRARERASSRSRARVALGEVGGVGRDAIGDQALLDVLFVGQAEMLLGGHVAEERRAVPGDHRRADRRGDVVVARGDVGDERPQGVERRLVADLHLPIDVLLDQVHGDVAGALDHHLAAVVPGDLGQLAQGRQLGELGLVVGVGDRAGAQAIAQGERDVVPRHQLADLLEAAVEEALAVVGEAPAGHDRAAAGDDAGQAVGGQRDVASRVSMKISKESSSGRPPTFSRAW
jgi:hypothetical protein